MHVYGELFGTLTAPGMLTGTLSAQGTIQGTLTIPSSTGGIPYEGEYEFTPTEEMQTVGIAGKQALQDITINPIPNNYGLITYNGTTITVS